MAKFALCLPFLMLAACNTQEKSSLHTEKSVSASLFTTLETDTTLADVLGVIYSPALEVVSADTAWVAGETNNAGVVFKTTDGGRSWTEQQRVSGTSIDAIAAVDAQTLWVSGNQGYVARSLDGGNSWQRIATGFSGYSPVISAVDADHAWVQNDDVILRTQDGGQTWMKLSPIAELASGIMTFRFVNRQQGYAIAAVGPSSSQLAFATQDGGLTWTQLTLPEIPVLNNQSNYQALSLSVIDADSLVLVSSLGSSYRSNDAGKTFQLATVFDTQHRDIGCFQFVDGNVGYLAAGDEIFVSRDGGQSWSTHRKGTSGLTDRCGFSDASRGLFLSTYGSVTRVN